MRPTAEMAPGMNRNVPPPESPVGLAMKRLHLCVDALEGTVMNYSGRLADVSASSDEPMNQKPVRRADQVCSSANSRR